MNASPGQPSNDSALSEHYDRALAISPGERLQKARKERKLEITAVAEQLNLSPGVVRALEADDYRMLPNATFVKGYLRSYARALGIPGDELVRGYEALTGCNRPEVVTPVAPPMIRPSRSPFRYGAIALVCAGLLALLMWWVPGGDGLQVEKPSALVTDPAALASSQDEPVPVGAAETTAPDTLDARDAETGLALATPEAAVTTPVDASSLEVDGETPTAEAVSPAVVPVAVAADAVAAASATALQPFTPQPLTPQPVQADLPAVVLEPGHGMLKLAFSGDCWVEVRDGKGKSVFSSLKRSGDEVTLHVAVPARVKLGNGDVVTVTFNDQPVAFSTSPYSKVVRLSLGGDQPG